MKTTNVAIIGALALVLVGCKHGSPTAPRYDGGTNPGTYHAATVSASSVKGSGGQMPALDDGQRVAR